MQMISFLNDTHMEEIVLYWNFFLKCKVGSFWHFSCLHNQLSSFNSIIVQMSEKRVHQIDSKNEWLLLSVTFTAKPELVFVLTFENGFS